MNFTLSISEEQLDLIRSEADRLNISVSAYIKLKTLEGLNPRIIIK